MKKIVTIGTVMLAGLALTACGQKSVNHSNTNSQTKTSRQSSSVQNSISRSATSSSSHAQLTDPKIIGILAYKDVYGSFDTENNMYFGNNSDPSNGNNGQYIVSSGSASGTISFSVNGDQVTIYKMESGQSNAEASYTSYTVSLQELEDKYYKSSSDQQSIQDAANNFKDANSTDNSDNGENDNNNDNGDQSDDD